MADRLEPGAGTVPRETAAAARPRLSRTRLFAVAKKEWIQLRRDPRSLILAFALPVLLLMLFGYAISWDVHDITMVVVDQDQSRQSRALVESFTASGYFRVVGHVRRTADVARMFERGTAQLAIVLPPGFEAGLTSPRPSPLQVIVDGSDANTATISLGYVRAMVQQWASREGLLGPTTRLPIVSESRVWYNEELSSRNMIVPGLIAVIMSIISAMLTSLTIAREWERGTMEQLAATPVSRAEVVLGKLLPYVGIGMADVVGTSLLGVFLFAVPFRGDVVLFVVMSFLFLTGALGLGIFISSLTKSQMVATQIAMLATFMPAFMLSGFMFSLDVMPAPLRAFTTIIPARHFLVVTRGLFLKGIGLDVLWPQALFMVAFALAGVGLAVRRFEKVLQP